MFFGWRKYFFWDFLIKEVLVEGYVLDIFGFEEEEVGKEFFGEKWVLEGGERFALVGNVFFCSRFIEEG